MRGVAALDAVHQSDMDMAASEQGIVAAPAVVDLPVSIGIRLVARGHLEDAARAQARMQAARDAEALHDFRVAVRRLRSCLRAYRPWFDDTVRRRDRRALRSIARSTSEARDLEVQLSWLKKRRRRMGKPAAVAATVLARRLREMQREANDDAARAVGRFDDAAAKLSRRLTRYTAEIDPIDPLRAPTTAEVAAGIAAVYAADVATQLDGVRTVEDGAAAHNARIAGKRLRYLLEPFRADTEGAAAAIDLAKSLQDDLGALHDLDVMLELVSAELSAAPADGMTASGDAGDAAGSAGSDGRTTAAEPAATTREGLVALVQYVHLERDAQFAAVQKTWLARDAQRLHEAVHDVTAELRAHTAPEVEIERKFLLRGMPRRRQNTHSVRIDQGWLPGDRLQERVRRVRGESGTRYYRTVKTGRGLSRREVEEETTETVFRALWPLTRGRRVSKRRLIVEDAAFDWVVDRFHGRDLVIAEVELPSPETPVAPPAWLDKWIEREVTGDPEYLNINLAQ